MWLDLMQHTYMSEETKGEESVKKVGSISYASYEEAASFDWTQMLIDQASKKKNQEVGPAFYAIKAVQAAYDEWGVFVSDADGDDDKISHITSALAATHKCGLEVFKPELVKLIGAQGSYQLSITCSIFGGMIGDTIVRALTGREKPIVNCLVFDGRLDGVGYVLKLGPITEKETTENGSLDE